MARRFRGKGRAARYGKRGRKGIMAVAPAGSRRGFFGPNQRLKRAMMGISEKKVHDVAEAAYECNNAPAAPVTCLNLVPAGTDYSSRIGRKYNMVSLLVDGFFALKAETVQCDKPVKLRQLIVYDKQPNTTLATSAMILASIGIGSIPNSTCPMNLDNRSRFRVISDTEVVLGPSGSALAGTTAINWDLQRQTRKIFKKFNLPTVCDSNAGTGTIGDITTGALLVLHIGNEASTVGDPYWQGTFRLRFHDM